MSNSDNKSLCLVMYSYNKYRTLRENLTLSVLLVDILDSYVFRKYRTLRENPDS
jgi:hypothetical protein